MKSIVERDPAERCFLCGTWGQLEKHHIFGGPNRKWSEKYGMTVHLCPVCHRDNRRGVHGDAEKMLAVHQIGQRAFEQKYSHKKFMQVFLFIRLGRGLLSRNTAIRSLCRCFCSSDWAEGF